jgi:hypothetical protein
VIDDTTPESKTEMRTATAPEFGSAFGIGRLDDAWTQVGVGSCTALKSALQRKRARVRGVNVRASPWVHPKPVELVIAIAKNERGARPSWDRSATGTRKLARNKAVGMEAHRRSGERLPRALN